MLSAPPPQRAGVLLMITGALGVNTSHGEQPAGAIEPGSGRLISSGAVELIHDEPTLVVQETRCPIDCVTEVFDVVQRAGEDHRVEASTLEVGQSGSYGDDTSRTSCLDRISVRVDRSHVVAGALQSRCEKATATADIQNSGRRLGQ